MKTTDHIIAAATDNPDIMDYDVYDPGIGPEDVAKGRMLRPAVVESITTLDLRTIERLVEMERFPTPVQLSDRRKAWRSGDVRDWLANPRTWVPY